MLISISCNNQLGKVSFNNIFGNQLLSINLPNLSISEGDPTPLLLVLSSPATANFTLRWTISGAGAASDFPGLTGTVNVMKDDPSVLINFPSTENFVLDGNRVYSFTLDSVDGTVLTATTVTLTVNDDETPGGPTISIADVSQAEGTGAGNTTYTFTVTLAALHTSNVVVDYTTSNGTATTADSDYVSTTNTLTILAGNPSGTFTVDVPRDTKFEGDETFTVTLSGGSGYTLAGSDMSATGTITNDDTAPTISIANVSTNEGNAAFTTQTFTVTQSAVSGVATTVDFATSNGTATLADTDYVTGTATVTIPAGSTTTTFDVSLVGDTKYEADETYTLTLSGGSNYTVAGSTLSATGTITNDDTAPTISIANVSLAEGSGGGTVNMTFTITQSAASGVATTVDYLSSDVTAAAGVDYQTATGTATIAVGATTTTFTVTIARDNTDEDDETFTMTLSNGANYTVLGSTLTATGTITDDDAPPTISIAAATATEGGNLTFAITLSAASGKTVGYDVATSNTTATAGSDYTASSLTGQTIAPGTTSVNFVVATTDDAVNCETTETITATISNLVNATAGTLSNTGTLNENDNPVFSLDDITVAEGGTANVTLTSTITCPANLSFNYSTRSNIARMGLDFALQENSLTLNSGTLTTSFNITTIDDSYDEHTETFFVRLNGNTVGTFSKPGAVITITDNDAGTNTARVRMGGAHTCVMSTAGAVKCWGSRSDRGVLGTGNLILGDDTGEMATLMDADLGTNYEPTKVSTAFNRTCAITTNGVGNPVLKCFGSNSFSTLGIGSTVSSIGRTPTEMGDALVPVDLGTGRYAVDVCGGEYMTCAQLDNGDAKCWGYGLHGSLGNGVNNASKGDTAAGMGDNLLKVAVGAGNTVTKISCSAVWACAVVSDGSLRCWGRGGPEGYLGNETGASQGGSGGDLPVVSLGTNLTALDIAVGGAHACALVLDSSDGLKKVKCWGNGNVGQTGHDSNLIYGAAVNTMGDNLPFTVFGIPEEPTKVWASNGATCVEFTAGKIRCFGAGYQNGQSNTSRGVSAGQMAALPDISFGAGLTVIDLSMWNNAVCAIVEDGGGVRSLKCFGSNTSRLGTEGLGPSGYLPAAAVTVNHGGGTLVRLSEDNADATHVCAIVDDGVKDVLRCWGSDIYSQLGRADRLIGDEPSEMGAGLATVDLGLDASSNPYVALDITLGSEHTCVLTTVGDVKCWGNGQNGAVGLGLTWGDDSGETSAAAAKVNLGAGRTAISLSASGHQTCAILDNFTLKCWGSNSSGQAGQGIATNIGTPPASPVDLGTNRFAISVGPTGVNTCAVLDNDTMKCWGESDNGVTGRNLAITDHVGDGAGEMGDNLPALDFGLDGGSVPYYPIQATGGGSYACAILNGGVVKCWGNNTFSMLGIDSGTSTGAAAQATIAATILTSFGQAVTYLSHASRHSCAILADETMKCWGYNSISNMGYADSSTRGSAGFPMATVGIVPLGGSKAIDLVANTTSSTQRQTCVLTDTYEVRCVGTNSSAQLGYGDITDRSGAMNLLPAVDIVW